MQQDIGQTPNTPAPSTAPARACEWCGTSLKGRNPRARFCSRGHKTAAWGVKHRAANPGSFAKYSRSPARLRYAEEHKEERRRYARERARRLRQDPAYAARQAAWWAANPQKAIEYQHTRRTRKIGNPGSVGVSERDWVRLVIRYGGRCAYCGRFPRKKIHMDHVVPLKLAGRHAIGNVLPACEKCNFSKNGRLLSDWRLRP